MYEDKKECSNKVCSKTNEKVIPSKTEVTGQIKKDTQVYNEKVPITHEVPVTEYKTHKETIPRTKMVEVNKQVPVEKDVKYTENKQVKKQVPVRKEKEVTKNVPVSKNVNYTENVSVSKRYQLQRWKKKRRTCL